eukprot:m.208355 g.208355  ORF g.208355 m.208355 type:complete len:705 (+) comp13764_c3_seq6:89-2203(+)
MSDNFLRFAPMTSSADAAFWKMLSEKKLNEFKLDSTTNTIFGQYSSGYRPNMPLRLCVGSDSFALEPKEARSGQQCLMSGQLISSNTLEQFKSQDVTKSAEDAISKVAAAITSKKVLSDNSLLHTFVVFTHSNLKKYKFYYWFCVPALVPSSPITFKSVKKLGDVLTEDEVLSLSQQWVVTHLENTTFSCGVFRTSKEDNGTLSTLESITAEDFETDGVYFCICDPGAFAEHPGWPVRNFLALLSKCGAEDKTVNVVCYRHRTQLGVIDTSPSIVLSVNITKYDWADATKISFVAGLEKNAKGKLGPRVCNLANTMDPYRLAESSAALNLRLMRWRLRPDVQLEKIAGTKCLLLGAGTLGCNVARNLIGWGVKHITFVDSGSVSYSNPVRQSLFRFEDSLDGGKPKAETAAKRLKEIFPSVTSEGVMMSIPMPGHPVSDTNLSKTMAVVKELEALICAHDAVFLLMDTKESRWLPTLICAVEKKICLTSALGFDSYLVMRHGISQSCDGEHTAVSTATTTTTTMSDTNATTQMTAGCYFCNDTNQPRNTTRDRSMDQQCTVSRPGISMVASASTVELMIALLHHPDGAACGYTEPDDDEATTLGAVPQQIRGSFANFSSTLIGGAPSSYCTACSHKVIAAWKEDRELLVKSALNDNLFLEDLTGVSDLKKMVDDFDDFEFDDDDEEDEQGGDEDEDFEIIGKTQ